jgi:N utilization substance protein B
MSVAALAEAGAIARSQARLAAVQALYQMDLAATDITDVITEFAGHRFGVEAEDPTVREADLELFTEIVKGVVSRQRDIDPPLDSHLAAGWRLHRIDAIVRAVLRSATYELLARPGVPARAVINEYVEIAKAFFETDEPRVVNAVLDKVARQTRPAEFAGRQKT